MTVIEHNMQTKLSLHELSDDDSGQYQAWINLWQTPLVISSQGLVIMWEGWLAGVRRVQDWSSFLQQHTESESIIFNISAPIITQQDLSECGAAGEDSVQ